MDLLDETADLSGCVILTAPARRGLLLLKSLFCFFICTLFLFNWTQYAIFSGALPWYRAMVPLCLPVLSAGFGLFFLFNAGKRLELLEDGIRYCTPFFKLEAPYSKIVSVRFDLENGQAFAGARRYSYQKISPVLALTLSLSDGRTWVFRTSFYSGLEQAETEIKKRI